MMNPLLTPLLDTEWHPIKNKEIGIEKESAIRTTKIWWLASCGHEWQTMLSTRIKGRGCPYCSGNRVLAGFNDLLTLKPELAKEWHPSLNGDLSPKDVSRGSKIRVWWICQENHTWDMPINARSVTGYGCPYCSGKRTLAGYNDLETLYPEIASEWHPTRNTKYTPQTVVGKSGKKVWWLCRKGHEWEALIANRTSLGSGCPVCRSGKVLEGYNDLNTLNKEIAGQWHPTLNGEILASNVTIGSSELFWWICEKGHEWQARPNDRTKVNAHNCPTCSNNRLLAGYNDLAFKVPRLVAEWHPTKNGKLLPNEVSSRSSRRVWWLSQECNHEWQSTISERTRKTPSGCPYCRGKKTLQGYNDLKTHQPELALMWHPTKNGNRSPEEFRPKSSKKVWWLDESCGHEWEASICHRANGSGCPHCTYRVSKPEQEIADFLTETGLTVEQGNRAILNSFELDIYIPSRKFAIEYNGVYWHTENKGKDKNYHRNKWLVCKNQGIQLVQIWEDEWNRNPDQIKAMLLHKLGLSQQEKVFARKTIIVELDKKCIEPFLEEHHIQGYAAGSHYLGLKDKNSNEIVSVMVLKKEKDNTLNIIRYATSKNVIGGFTKLLSYAEKAFSPSKFITFSDHCVSDGGLYQNNGFIIDKELAPDYRYVVNGQRHHKFGYRLKRFRNDPKLEWVDGLTERELATLNDIPRIWDAGKTRWVKYIYFS